MIWVKELMMRKIFFDNEKKDVREFRDLFFGYRLGEKGKLGLVKYENYRSDGTLAYVDDKLWCVFHVPTGMTIKTSLLPMKMRRSLKTMKEFVEELNKAVNLTWNKKDVFKMKKEYGEFVHSTQARFMLMKKRRSNGKGK